MFLYNYNELKRITKTNNGKKLIEEVEKAYTALYKNKPITATNYSYQKQIYTTGNRELWQDIFFERRKRLCYLQLLAIANDEYLEDLENVLAVILEEYTWVLPAHNVRKDNTFDYTVIDLFSAETGFYLSETLYVFNDKLSDDIKYRIKTELKNRIIDNYENREQLWYNIHNNWAAVCAGGVGITYMYAFPERFEKVKDRLFKTMECYLVGTREDGVTPEGVGYWVYGFGFFLCFFDIYNQLYGEYPEILKQNKILNTLKYIDNAHLGGNCYLPFSDGGYMKTYVHAPVVYAAKRLFKDKFALPKISIDQEFVMQPEVVGKSRWLRVLYGVENFGLGVEKEPVEKTVYYAQSEIFIRKSKKYSFAAKCGHNYEMHNHNDVGSFQIVVDGKSAIVDAGPAEYTWQYFNDVEFRYGEHVFGAGSMGHSVPIVNGKYQSEGRQYSGKVLEQTDYNFKIDISAAYGNIDELIVNYQMLSDRIKVSYNCSGIEDGNISFRFLSFNKPVINSDGNIDVGVVLKSTSGLKPEINKIEFSGHISVAKSIGKVEVYAIDYKLSGNNSVVEEFEFIV
jgi:hypothetical protein